MNQHNSVEITDKDGWRKSQPLKKRLIHIGSDPRNDIVLESWRGAGVASRHLQLIAAPADGGKFRLVNLGDTEALLGATGDQVLPPRSSVDVADGVNVKLGDFGLVFRLEDFPLDDTAISMPTSASPGVTHHQVSAVSAKASSKAIKMELFLPQTQLEPDHTIDGSVIVRNLGDQPAVQFKLAVEGLPSDCFDIGAGPLLFPNAEKEIYFRLFHPRGPSLSAGDHRFSIHARAPEAYPGESATVSQVIRVLPFYQHKLRLAPRE